MYSCCMEKMQWMHGINCLKKWPAKSLAEYTKSYLNYSAEFVKKYGLSMIAKIAEDYIYIP